MSRMVNFLSKHRWLLLIALLSFLLKLNFVLQGAVVNSDAAIYISAAEKYSHGLFSEGLKFYRMPFYPLLLATVHAIVPDWIVAGRILTVVPLWLTLFPLYALSRRLFSHHSALWTALLFAVIPTFNASSSDIKRDPLFLLFTIAAVMFLVLFFHYHRKRDMFWFALLVVLATLTRIEGVLLLVVGLVAVPICGWVRGGWRLVARTLIGLIAVPLIMVLVLWGLETMGLHTSSRLTEVTSWITRFADLKLFAGYQRLMATLKEFQQTLPSTDLHNNLIEITRHYAPLIYLVGLLEMLLKGIFPASLIGLWGLRWRKRELVISERWVLVLMWLGFILLNLLFNVTRNFTTERYLWIPIVLTLPWVGEGVRLWWQRYDTKKVVVWTVLVIIFVAPLSKTFAVMACHQDTTVVEAGRWLKLYDPQQQLMVMYNDRRLPLYSDRFSEVKKIYKLSSMTRILERKHQIDLIALYLVKDKYANLSIEGFESVKVFKGQEKTVFIFQRL